MKQFLYTGILITTLCNATAQQPVRFELQKVAEATVLPTLSAAEAYNKSFLNGQLDSSPLFGVSDNRFNQIFTGLADRSDRQLKKEEKTKEILTDAHAAGFEKMSAQQKEAYLKANPGLQKQTGVDPSALELAAKMQDPAFVKKLEGMNNTEKAAVLSQYTSQSASAAARKSDPANARILVQVSQLVNRFNEEYRVKNLEAVETALLDMNNKTDGILEQQLYALQKEKEALPPLGKGASAKTSESHALIEKKTLAAKIAAWDSRLKGYREIISSSLSLFKLSAAPFDQWMAESGYGAKYKNSSQTDLLAQLAGYQEGYFRILRHLQDLCKDVTMRAAAFYEQEVKR
ncbi:MAG: hypothetical protein QM781_17125 [Chitinophagaceae bacterium]